MLKISLREEYIKQGKVRCTWGAVSGENPITRIHEGGTGLSLKAR
jgi:hypothetical protein